MSTFHTIYAQGLHEEQHVISQLKLKFPDKDISASTAHQNIHEDIDCWINGKSISIKAQHAGIKYNNIYMELAQAPKSISGEVGYIDGQAGIDELLCNGWEESWYYYSQADLYAILQGQLLRVYKKEDIQDYVKTHGWLRIKGLTHARRQYLIEADYRYNNAICGYLNPDLIKSYNITLDAAPAPPEPVKPQRRNLTATTRPRALVTL